MKGHLDDLVERYRIGKLDSDPIGIVRTLTRPEDIEIGAFFSAALALGRVGTIREKTRELFDRMDGEPFKFVTSGSTKSLRGFGHRFFTESDFVALTLDLRRLLRKYSSLGESWPERPFEEALTIFAGQFSPRAGIPLIASPENGSTCKRILMYLRWMVRSDEIDFGLWKRPAPRDLVIPMDTHIFKVSRLLGLTRARTPSWRAAVEVTDRLREFDPHDPVKYDFALSRLGIIEGCRAKYVPHICDPCAIRSICTAAAA